ncbi:hypothetical protein A3H65_01165 [Candidatus Giovannonibacteria bacterium RIFCSPLOWO2_02_FULL_45_14]|nr:MAG: hypothetical protein A3E62_00500 [Candidatus Giovannonibacteria bacterium RIFCSPHIGHO2_12_FULL_44_29]OGF90950.1 MAG: hypothetical protein A3H65_01165 [Candidatus Giovannonibacteria bacterium RIFCSPLOWO2_02_FULL_45_14]
MVLLCVNPKSWPFGPFAWSARQCFRRELEAFELSGLYELQRKISQGWNLGTSWKSCPLSFRKGYCGSVKIDSSGHEANNFTDYWDTESAKGRISTEHLLKQINREIERRKRLVA